MGKGEGQGQEGRGEVEFPKRFSQHLKGDEHALDHFYSSLGFVGAGIDDRLHHGWSHSCSFDHRHHRGAGPGYPRTKTNVTISHLV